MLPTNVTLNSGPPYVSPTRFAMTELTGSLVKLVSVVLIAIVDYVSGTSTKA